MEECMVRTFWSVTWFVNVPDGVLEDTDILIAESGQDAVDQWVRKDDIPEGAQIISVEQDDSDLF